MLDIINRFGYIGVALLIAVENLFPPIPSEIILTFAGFLTTCSQLTVFGTVIASSIGSMAGAAALYWLGRALPVDKIEGIVKGRLGRALRFKESDLTRTKGWFLRHGGRTVFFCRFIPVVRSLISIPAGMARMKPLPFIIFTALGTIAWNTALISIGALAGEAWESAAHYVDTYSKVFYVAGAVLAVAVITLYILRRFRKAKA